MAISVPEGTVCLIPERNSTPLMGLVARRVPRGRIVALYIFDMKGAADRWRASPLEGSLPKSGNALFKGRFSDYMLRTGEWPSLGVHPRFHREQWPFDRLLHRDAITGRCTVISLDDRDPTKEVGAVDVDCSMVTDLPEDGIRDPVVFMERTLPQIRGSSND